MSGVKGRSGGPRPNSGRKRGKQSAAAQSIVELAKSHSPEMLKVLVAIGNNINETASARVSAANSVIERGYGRPPQSLEHTGKDGGDVRHDIRIVIVKPKGR
jgi:hypothetical protein